MARLDVHPTPRGGRGLVVDVQTRFLDRLATRAVIPKLPVELAPRPMKGLNPTFEIGGASYVLVMQAIVSVPAKELGQPVGSLDSRHDHVTRALDMLLLGY